ncbi:MAG: hypothetical protein ABIT37_22490 [Luteolibacter sp.]
MSMETPIPEPPPMIARGPLWTALAVPPVATVVANMGIGLLSRQVNDIAAFSLGIPPLVLILTLVLWVLFHKTVRQRYRGTSLAFLNAAYIFGQIIVCLSLWLGSCALFFPPMNFH